MEMGIGGFIQPLLRPFMESFGCDSVVSIVVKLVSIEIVACAHLQEPVHLFTHQIKNIKFQTF
jgi:hypothetical protein